MVVAMAGGDMVVGGSRVVLLMVRIDCRDDGVLLALSLSAAVGWW
jgi:hypothetical protein